MNILGKTRCPLTGKILEQTDFIVCFPHFIFDNTDPLWRYSESCMLREAFNTWGKKKDFLERWKTFECQRYSLPHWKRLLQDDNFLIVLGQTDRKVRLIFFQHGLVLDIPVTQWTFFLKFLETLNAQRVGTPHLFKDSLIVQFEQDGNFLKISVYLQDGAARQDRINLSQPEWTSFLNAVQTATVDQET